jgi:spore cortex formation protein SpoVR/YcgB (stage V sporulation)
MSPDPKIRQMTEKIAAIARGYGLDFFDTIFEVVDFDQMNEVASYGGFPNRYPHWQFGMEYERVSKGYRYGLQKIYERTSSPIRISSRTTTGSATPTARWWTRWRTTAPG